MRRLSPVQRAYLLGFRKGVRWAWNRTCGKAQAWEDEITMLQADYESLVGELRQVRDEQAVKQALVERAMPRRMASLAMLRKLQWQGRGRVGENHFVR